MITTLQEVSKRFSCKGCLEVKLDLIHFSGRQNGLQSGDHLRLFISVLYARFIHKWDDHTADTSEFAAREKPTHFFNQGLTLKFTCAQEGLVHEVIGTQ